jgi:5,10-methenyltetrahydrofolate synthetase
MKATLRKELRAERRALSEPEHWRRSLAAAKAIAPISPQWLDLIVIPLVGVDAKGGRPGMGCGYYDRALAFRRRRRCRMGPHLVGLAFDCQRTHAKFADAWGLRLDSLATESGMEHFL